MAKYQYKSDEEKMKPMWSQKRTGKLMKVDRRGKPRIEIDKENFEKLCGLLCTKREIAAFFNCSEDTIENWCNREYGTTFSKISKEKMELGKISLRRAQFNLAHKSAQMAIWLGKNYLDQKDEITYNVNEIPRIIDDIEFEVIEGEVVGPKELPEPEDREE